MPAWTIKTKALHEAMGYSRFIIGDVVRKGDGPEWIVIAAMLVKTQKGFSFEYKLARSLCENMSERVNLPECDLTLVEKA